MNRKELLEHQVIKEEFDSIGPYNHQVGAHLGM